MTDLGFRTLYELVKCFSHQLFVGEGQLGLRRFYLRYFRDKLVVANDINSRCGKWTGERVGGDALLAQLMHYMGILCPIDIKIRKQTQN